jgi:predicted metalloprotease with PDZ domain
MLLDVQIQSATGGHHDLGDVMRQLWKQHRASGYSQEDFERLCEEVGGGQVAGWLRHQIAAPGELDFEPLLDWYGLRFKEKPDMPKNPLAPPPEKSTNGAEPSGAENGSPEKRDLAQGDGLPATRSAYLGLEAALTEGKLVVKRVTRRSPAAEAGVNVDDEILAIDRIRIAGDGLNERLDYYRAQDQIGLLLSRRGRVIEVDVRLGARPSETWELEVDPAATEEQKGRLSGWLQ